MYPLSSETMFSLFLGVTLMVASTDQVLATEEIVSPPTVMCHYNDLAFLAEGPLKVGPEELKPALDKCTHLMYNYVQLSKDFEIQPEHPDLAFEKGSDLFRKITDLKSLYPKLKVLIAFGGFDSKEAEQKYLDVLRQESLGAKLISSTLQFLKKYNFDGVNMGWMFPVQPERIITKYLKQNALTDLTPEKTRAGFGALVQQMAKALKPEKFLTTVTVVPHVDFKTYYDIPALNDAADLIILESHDFPAPSSKHDFEDSSVPIYYVSGKQQVPNIEKKIRYFIEKGADAKKLILTVSSYGSWALVKKSDLNDTPGIPKQAVGGVVTYFEVCSQLKALNDKKHPEEFVQKLNFYLGDQYFKQPAKQLKDDFAIWMAYEDKDNAAFKTSFAKKLGLGGVALNALMFDDHRGICGEKYPILETIATSWK